MPLLCEFINQPILLLAKSAIRALNVHDMDIDVVGLTGWNWIIMFCMRVNFDGKCNVMALDCVQFIYLYCRCCTRITIHLILHIEYVPICLCKTIVYFFCIDCVSAIGVEGLVCHVIWRTGSFGFYFPFYSLLTSERMFW